MKTKKSNLEKTIVVIICVILVTTSFSFIATSFHYEQNIDNFGPNITINFAGNLGESGGSYWQLP